MKVFEVDKKTYIRAKDEFKGMIFHRKENGRYFIKCYSNVAKKLHLL